MIYSKRIMSLDMGDVRLGIAVSDPLRITAQGIESYTRKPDINDDFDHLISLIENYQVELIVCGLPKNMNDTLGPMAEKVMAFADELQKRSGVRIVFEDERLTTVFAEKILIDADLRRNKRRQVIDKMAAVAILQGFIDRKGWETINEQ